MKLTMFIGILVIVLLCVVGFTQNEFITDTNTTYIDTDLTLNTVSTWGNVNLEKNIVSDIIFKTSAGITFYENPDNFPNPFNYSLGTDQYAIARTAGTQNDKEELSYLYEKTDESGNNILVDAIARICSKYEKDGGAVQNIIPDRLATLRISKTTGIDIGADILKCPTYSILAG